MKQTITIFALLLSLIAAPLTEAKSAIGAKATDTIAGYSTTISSSKVSPNTSVIFTVTKPDGSQIMLPSTADASGFASAEFFGYHTKKAGKYQIAASLPGDTPATAGLFQVYAGDASTRRSSIETSADSLTANGSEKSFVTVTVRDKYDNPVSNHSILLVSSLGSEEIRANGNTKTNANGQVTFQITSRYPGNAVLSAVDSTAQMNIEGKAKIVYFAPAKAMGGNDNLGYAASLLKADIAAATGTFGPLDHFDIDFPDTVAVNSDQNFLTVTAKDKNGNTVRDYVGTIIISTPEDDNATLPNDGKYTFSPQDLGTRKFDLALVFQQIGKVTIKVNDYSPQTGVSRTMKGEKVITVTTGGISSSTGSSLPTSGDVIIKSPTSGAEVGSRDVTIMGKALPNTNLKIFDNDAKIGEAEADIDGMFSFSARSLADGKHAVYAMEMDGSKLTSETISFTVDATPPALSSIEIFPNTGVAPGSKYTVSITSEIGLDRVNIRVFNELEPLSADPMKSGLYSATLTAPSVGGDYPVDTELTDRLGNKGSYSSAATLKVLKPAANLPPQVTGVTATPGNASVTINWAPVQYTTPIAKYRVWYGTDQTVKGGAFETKSAVTTMALQGLQNGVSYYFAVSAIDQNGAESGELSIPVSATPSATAVVSPTPTTPTTTSPNLTAIAGDGVVTLVWDVLASGAAHYKVEYGVQSGIYLESRITADNRTTVAVQDLINGVPYFFRVTAVDTLGNATSAPTAEAAATPTGYGFRPIASPVTQKIDFVMPKKNAESGPETTWLIALSLLFCFAYFAYRRHTAFAGIPALFESKRSEIESPIFTFAEPKVEVSAPVAEVEVAKVVRMG